jgi:iron complex transport system permease protein
MAALCAGLFLALLAGLMIGSVAIPPGEVLSRLWAALLGHGAQDATDQILLVARLPRLVLAASVGSVLALAGLAAQTLFRNPLATPSIIGVSSGSALGAVLGLLLAGRAGFASAVVVPTFSVASGLAVTAIVFALGRRGSFFGHALLLAGIAIGSLCSSLTTASLYLAGERLQAIVFWLMGGLWQANWQDACIMLPLAIGALAALWLLAPSLNVALLGERSAHDLGLNLPRLQKGLLLIIAVTTAVAVSLTGVIGFIGLVVPHLLRLVFGADHRRLVPATALGGALLLVLADTLARTLAAPAEIPVGILTAVVGAPVFLWLLNQRLGRPVP